MTDLSITITDHPAFTLITLDGELDRLSAGRLGESLDQVLACGRVHLVIDVGALTFCDSSGLWTLISCQRQATAVGGSVRLAGAHGVVRRLLEITRLTDLFPHDDVVPALRPTTP
ncbi:anti-sigma-factor antagonist [Planomonospora sphaerica]|uniref:Anti-sigma factor antagonist n=1 Tax=Planomonospora sphaerica TaxID=161355 RepID=A0A161MBG6_9ACTN|nr:STAS domain-containing protein [Planomonospora sphaerica]GAT67323.1 anti-sigma-factor antagonist [Planomonospora sphaerica]